jgi:hypothetical protein
MLVLVCATRLTDSSAALMLVAPMAVLILFAMFNRYVAVFDSTMPDVCFNNYLCGPRTMLSVNNDAIASAMLMCYLLIVIDVNIGVLLVAAV